MEGNQTKPNLHPLLLEPVLTKILQYIPLSDLSSCILVCKQWFNSSLTTWRSQKTLRLTHSIPWYANRVENQGQPNLYEFLKFWEDNPSSSKPYRRISCEYFTAPVPSMSYDMDRFWKCIGQHLTHVTLHSCHFQDANEAQRITYDDCPNLQLLTMVGCEVLNGNYQDNSYFRYGEDQEESYIPPKFGEHKNLRYICLIECLPDSWLGILSHFSSLEHLRLVNSFEDALVTWKMLEAAKMIREEQGRDRLQIKYFEEPFRLKPDPKSVLIFDLLRELNLPVDSLNIILERDTDQNFVDDVLTNHCQTIRKIDSINYGFQGCVSFPSGVELATLQKLKLCDGLFQNLEFLKHTPNLRDFLVRDSSGFRELMAYDIPQEPYYLFSYHPALNMDNVKVDALTKLCLDCLISPEQLQNLSQWTPNVKILTMYLDDRKVAIVCGSWKKLVKLKDYGARISDWGICGEDEETGQYIQILRSLKTWLPSSPEVAKWENPVFLMVFYIYPDSGKLRWDPLWRRLGNKLTLHSVRKESTSNTITINFMRTRNMNIMNMKLMRTSIGKTSKRLYDYRKLITKSSNIILIYIYI